MNKKVFILSLLLCIPFTFLHAQNGTQLLDYDAQSLGRGGTSIGYFDSPVLMMTNPGGLSFIDGSILDVNFSLMAPSLHFQNSINNLNGKKNYYPLPSLSYVRNNNSKWTWGIGLFTSGGMGADFTMNHALFRDQSGNYIQQKYHSMLAVMQGGPSLAYKFTPNLSIGLTAHLVYSMMQFETPYSLSPMAMQGVVNPTTGMTFGQMFAAPPTQGGFGYNEVTAAANMKDLSTVTFNGRIGLAYKPNENFSLGITYTLPTNLNYKNGKASMDMTAQFQDAFGKAIQGYMMQNPGVSQQDAQAAVMQQFSQMGIDMQKGMVADYDLEADLKLPQSVGIGMSFKASKQLRFAFDGLWLNWAKAFNNMKLKLSNGTNANINLMMGNDGTFNIDFPLEWKNTIVLKFGTEYDISDKATVRGGYVYGSNPVPNQTVFPVFPAIVENHVMLGLSYLVSKPLRINFAFEHAFTQKQTASSISMVASEYDSSVSQLSTTLFHVSLDWSFK